MKSSVCSIALCVSEIWAIMSYDRKRVIVFERCDDTHGCWGISWTERKKKLFQVQTIMEGLIEGNNVRGQPRK